MIAIIDADILNYRAAYASEINNNKVMDKEDHIYATLSTKSEALEYIKLFDEEEQERLELRVERETTAMSPRDAKMILTTMIKNIKKKTKAHQMKFFLTGDTNFRNDVATLKVYKGSRDHDKRPINYQIIRDHLEDKYEAHVSVGEEADDTCSIELFKRYKKAEISKRKYDCNAIVCSIDKDLLNTPGWHYNIAKKITVWVTNKSADRRFAMQLLTGDSADDIPGVSFLSNKKKLIGPKRAEDTVEGCETKQEMYDAICEVYEEFVPGDWHAKLQEVGILLWMRREPGQMFCICSWKDGQYD